LITAEEMMIYQRQMVLDEVGFAGQTKFKEAKIAVVGAGGLGCPVLIYLATSGIGNLGIIDFDSISQHNLHRQILFTREDINRNKAEVAFERLKIINPEININIYTERLNEKNAIRILTPYDIIIDGSDNFETRYTVSDACEALNKPLVSGSIYKFEGQISVFNYNGKYSYRDLFHNPPENDAFNCSITGVMGSTCSVIAGLMVNEVYKVILQTGDVLSGKILQINLLTMSFNIFSFNKIQRPKE